MTTFVSLEEGDTPALFYVEAHDTLVNGHRPEKEEKKEKTEEKKEKKEEKKIDKKKTKGKEKEKEKVDKEKDKNKEKEKEEEKKGKEEIKEERSIFYKKLSKFVDEQKYSDLFDEGIIKLFDKAIALTVENELETIFSLSFYVLSKIPKPSSYITKITQTLTQQTSFPIPRLTLLNSLFNLDISAPNRPQIFNSLLKFAYETGQSSALLPHFKYIDQWISDWKLQGKELSEMYLLLSNVAKATGQHAENQRFLYKYLQSLEKANKNELDAAKPHAHSVVVTALGSPSVMQFDTLLNLNAVKQLQQDKNFSNTYTLLRIFTNDTVESYNKFISEHKDYVAKIGLDNEELLRKLRSLTICSLGAEKDRIPYETLRKRLQLADSSAVESCVIDAVTSGCIEAKLDENNDEVIIVRTTRRIFDSDGWKQLSLQLTDWRKNVQTVLGSLHQIQARAPQVEEKESTPVLKL